MGRVRLFLRKLKPTHGYVLHSEDGRKGDDTTGRFFRKNHPIRKVTESARSRRVGKENGISITYLICSFSAF